MFSFEPCALHNPVDALREELVSRASETAKRRLRAILSQSEMSPAQDNSVVTSRPPRSGYRGVNESSGADGDCASASRIELSQGTGRAHAGTSSWRLLQARC